MLSSLAANAQVASYADATRQLTLPSVQVGSVTYNNVVLRLDSFAVLAAGPPTPVALPACVQASFTVARYNAIQAGMTLDQVNTVMGCTYSPVATQRNALFSSYAWMATVPGSGVILVYFDPGSTRVTPLTGGSVFKSASGF